MKGNAEVLEVLGEILAAELTAINQYFIHAKMNKNKGYVKLAKYLQTESIGEMKHADAVIERILFFDGVPDLQRYTQAKLVFVHVRRTTCIFKPIKVFNSSLKEFIF